tara:strand:+ start:23 stop:502 length:480 start_codon:yes stop_codon:yes gene_type:complete
MNIYKNFLPKKVFKRLKDGMMGEDFPWYYSDNVNYKDDVNIFQFTFNFISKNGPECWGEWYDMIVPVLKKLKVKPSTYRVKANLLTRTDKILEQGMHIDQDYGTTGILYINKCNGYTKFKNGEKIKSEENKYVEFSSELPHTGSSCSDEKRRVVINFNY